MKKIFKVTNQQPGVWSDATHTLLGWEINDKNLIITKIKGCDVTLDGFLSLCEREHNELKEVCKDYKRVSPYKLVEKRDNRYRPIIKYLIPRGNFWEERKQEIIYVSCYWKLPDQTIFIPDLLLLLEEWKDIMEEIEYIKIKEIKNIIDDPKKRGYTIP